MAISIELIDETGNRLAEVSDVHDLVERIIDELASSSVLLSHVDPYGLLILNRLQMPDFLNDWRRAERLIGTDLDRRSWEQVKMLATRVLTEPHVYLRFSGD